MTLTMALLATMAIPAFGEQSGKARDARAKQIAHEAAIAIETCRVESVFDSYENCSAELLRSIDPTLPPSPCTAKGEGGCPDSGDWGGP